MLLDFVITYKYITLKYGFVMVGGQSSQNLSNYTFSQKRCRELNFRLLADGDATFAFRGRGGGIYYRQVYIMIIVIASRHYIIIRGRLPSFRP